MLLDHQMTPDALNDMTHTELKALFAERIRRHQQQEGER